MIGQALKQIRVGLDLTLKIGTIHVKNNVSTKNTFQMVTPDIRKPNIRELGWIRMHIHRPHDQRGGPRIKLIGVEVIVMHWAGFNYALSQGF